MNIKKKGASLAFTATLLASLLATVAAPAALATVTVAGVGTIAAGQTSTTPATYTLRENGAALFTGGDGTAACELSVTITDSALAATVTFGTPSIVAPGSLGATVTGAGTNVLCINWPAAGSSAVDVEQIVVSATITAGAVAASGAIRTFISGFQAAAVLGPTGTATGTLIAPIPAGATVLGAPDDILLTGFCAFTTTGAGVPAAGTATFSDTADARAVTGGAVTTDGDAVLPDPGDTQDVAFAAGSVGHPAGVTVTQTVPQSSCSGEVASSGTVARALTQSAAGPTQVLPGQNNQPAGTVTLSETAPASNGAQFAAGQVVTFTISNPAAGVLFSASPAVTTAGGLTTSAGLCQISADRRSCTVTITGVSGAFESITIGPVLLDVDASVPLGTPVVVTASISPAVAINNTGGVIAFVGRVIIGSAATPNIIIGANNQVTGAITLRESGPGFFQAGLGSNNTFAVCLQTGEVFTTAPTATVTAGGGTGAGGGAPGNFQLLNPVTAGPTSSIAGTLYNGNACVYWTVFSASTAGPATITITDGTTNSPNGPHVNVPAGSPPGTTQAAILVGTFATVVGSGGCAGVATCALNPGYAGAVAIAVRVFNGGITVTASSQPRIPAGSNNALAGDIVLTEVPGAPAMSGRFRLGQTITFVVLARATPIRQEVLINSTNTADSPRVVTNGSESGLLSSPAVVVCPPIIPFIGLCTVTTVITQQSFGGPGMQPGTLRLENIHYNVLADAQNGAVQVQVTGNGFGGATPFQAIVTNAIIGNEPPPPARTSIINGSLAGVVKVSEGRTFTAATKVVDAGDYVTWLADMDPANSGERVRVWIAKRSSSSTTWSAFTAFSTRAVNSQGLTVFHYDNGDVAGWVSVKFSFDGNASHGPATSLARQARYV